MDLWEVAQHFSHLPQDQIWESGIQITLRSFIQRGFWHILIMAVHLQKNAMLGVIEANKYKQAMNN